MAWQFNSSTGWLSDPDGNQVERGYAGGELGLRPDAINNKAFQYVEKVGPLPVGTYTMGTPISGTHLGPFAIPLTPDPSNEMGGRSDFFIHGDTTPSGKASEGCVILSRATRLALIASDDKQIEVI